MGNFAFLFNCCRLIQHTNNCLRAFGGAKPCQSIADEKKCKSSSPLPFQGLVARKFPISIDSEVAAAKRQTVSCLDSIPSAQTDLTCTLKTLTPDRKSKGMSKNSLVCAGTYIVWLLGKGAKQPIPKPRVVTSTARGRILII